jgi:hypothetical protein
MFARPYAPSSDSKVAVSPRKAGINNPNAKHYKLFRQLPLGAQPLPNSSVLEEAAVLYPSAASPFAYSAAHRMPLSAAASAQESPYVLRTPQQPPAQAFQTPLTGRPNSSPRRRPVSALPESARSPEAMEPLNSAFLAAVAARQNSEADRLALFNRLAHLRASEERAERHIEQTSKQIRAVQTARERHARDAVERKANEDWWIGQRIQTAQAARESAMQRRAALEQYNRDMLAMKRAAAQQQRQEARELLVHRGDMAAETVERVHEVRAHFAERTRLFRARQQMRHSLEESKWAEVRARRIELEYAKRQVAEQDVQRMAAEEAALMARVAETEARHQQTLAHFADLVKTEETLPTLRATYTPMHELMNFRGVGSPRSSERRQSQQAIPMQQFVMAQPQSPRSSSQSSQSVTPQPYAPLSPRSSQTTQSPRHSHRPPSQRNSLTLSLSIPSPFSMHRIQVTDASKHGKDEEKQQQQHQQQPDLYSMQSPLQSPINSPDPLQSPLSQESRDPFPSPASSSTMSGPFSYGMDSPTPGVQQRLQMVTVTDAAAEEGEQR